MKILVTGWNGHNRSFIPLVVANHLKSKGHEVHGWEWNDNWKPTDPTIYGWTWSDLMKQYVHATKDGNDWKQSPLSSYDLVVHLGAISSTEETDVDRIMKQNFDFSLWLLNQCQYHKIPLQYASSASVYGSNLSSQEDTKLNPTNPYSWSKYLFDRIVRDNLHSFETPVVGFRYFNVYGAAEKHKGEQASILFKWDEQALNENSINVFEGSEGFYRDFVYVNDVAKLHEQFIGKETKGIFNVGSGKATCIMDLAKRFQDKTGCSINIIPMPKSIKNHYQKYTCADLDKLNAVVDFEFTLVEDYIDNIL